jgi:signal transduction histidine kinase
MSEPDTEPTAWELLQVSQETLWQTHRTLVAGRLADGAGHEFNNLMQGIVASLELTRKLIATGRAPETQPFIEKAIASARRAALLNGGLAHFALPRPIVPVALSLNAVIADMQDLLRYSLPRSIKIDTRLATNLWTTYCDAGQARLAIVDLVLDTCDSMRARGTIAVETRNDDEVVASARQNICIAVTAIGGNETWALDREWSPVSPTNANNALDALAMVERFAHIYGGEVRVCNEASRRVAAELYLPRSENAKLPQGGE